MKSHLKPPSNGGLKGDFKTSIKAHIPNGIALARLVMGPVVLWAGLTVFPLWLTTLIAVLALASDAVDGYLARRWRVESAFGMILDPLADKIFAGSLFLMLGLQGFIPWWFLGIVVGRDLFLLGGSLILLRKKIPVLRPLMISKVNTILQGALAVVILGALLLETFSGYPPGEIYARACWIVQPETNAHGLLYALMCMGSHLWYGCLATWWFVGGFLWDNRFFQGGFLPQIWMMPFTLMGRASMQMGYFIGEVILNAWILSHGLMAAVLVTTLVSLGIYIYQYGVAIKKSCHYDSHDPIS